jgi:beta-phosphoglucomutase-like phosphatase (HAD superfamily)
MAAANNYTADVLARLREYFSLGAQWQRTLWRVGPAFALRELIESADGVQNDALSPKALKRHAEAVARMLSDDPAAGAPEARRRLLALLTQDLTAGGANYRELKLWLADVEQNSLARWGAAVTQDSRPSREQFARAIACELFRQGFSATRLHPWVGHLNSDAEAVDEQELIARTEALISEPSVAHEALLTFSKPLPAGIHSAQALDATEVAAWLERNNFQRVRQHGGLLLQITARDRHAAAQAAADTADRLLARAAVGTREVLRFDEKIHVAGHSRPIAARRARRAEVRTLERQGRLLDLTASERIDQALELLANLNTAPAPVAAAAGWAAVESLLSGPGDVDKVITAERLANLVACSWPRAELTTIAWARIKQSAEPDAAIAVQLREAASNRERAERILAAILAQEPIGLTAPAERLALTRMQKLAAAPRRELLGVREQAGDALRRLYRHRNLVVHGGMTAGFGLVSALRTAAPLVGAGLDRVTHAALAGEREPLEIAARAQLELERAGTPGAPSLTEMLE